MSTFDLEGFLSDPSVEQIDRCRKKDLYAIAAHFEFAASPTLLKAELKEAVVHMLVQKKVLGTGSSATASEPAIPHPCLLVQRRTAWRKR